MRRLALLLAALAGVAAFVRSRAAAAESVALHYGDGSSVTLVPGMPGADRVLAAARRLV